MVVDKLQYNTIQRASFGFDSSQEVLKAWNDFPNLSSNRSNVDIMSTGLVQELDKIQEVFRDLFVDALQEKFVKISMEKASDNMGDRKSFQQL